MHATATPKLVDQQPAFLAVLATLLFAAGIALGAALPGLDLKIAPSAAVSVPDTSYNAVERVRAQFGVTPDTSYNTVESIRAQSGVTGDTSSKVGKSGFPSTRGRGISAHDKARGFGGWWASAAAGTAAGTPVSQAQSNDRYGAGIR